MPSCGTVLKIHTGSLRRGYWCSSRYRVVCTCDRSMYPLSKVLTLRWKGKGTASLTGGQINLIGTCLENPSQPHQGTQF